MSLERAHDIKLYFSVWNYTNNNKFLKKCYDVTLLPLGYKTSGSRLFSSENVGKMAEYVSVQKGSLKLKGIGEISASKKYVFCLLLKFNN